MLEGDIKEINLIERFVELWREQFTGAIRFENDGIIKIIYFKGGDILSASTNDRADSIDEILMRAGKVSREHVKQALAKRKESETLGDALLNLGFITRKELTWARRVQVVGVIRSIDAWPTGSFTIVSDYLPKRDEGTLFPLPQVLIELIVTDPDRAKYEQLLDGGRAVYEKAAGFDEAFHRFGLNEDADAIASAIDGHSTAAEVAETSGRDPFNAYRLLHALGTLQLLSRADKPEATHEVSASDFESASVADAADMWDDAPAVEPPAAPRFQFDEAEAARQPTLEVAVDTSNLPHYPGSGGASEASADESSAWDEPAEQEPESAGENAMPSWNAPGGASAAPIAATAPAQPSEEQWGFDEAQVETARRAGATRRSAVSRKPAARGRRGWLVGLLVLAAVALLGYGGFLYWQKSQESDPVPVATRPTLKRTPSATPAETGTIVPVDATTTGAAATEPVAVTTTVAAAAPVSAPLVVSTSAAPAARPVSPASPADSVAKARVDAQAREYLAIGQGNFTVQIQILCDVGNLEKAVRDGAGEVWFVPQPIGSRSCYRVLWGRYETRDEAQRAMAAIPASLRDPSAAVKPVPKP